MAGSFTPVRGATAAATPTVFFSTVCDRLTMLYANYTGGNRPNSTPAFLANQFSISAASFDGFTTAPDGTTNTMQLIKEDNSTGTHSITAAPWSPAITSFGLFDSLPRMRMSGFFKAGGRTRVALEAKSFSAAGGGPSTINAVFDLVGGQVAGAPVVTNPANSNASTSFGSQIISFGSGVYRCDLDFTVSWNLPTSLQCNVYLDAGSGTGAANQSYTGNSTSGVYGWKMSLMPVGAYGINNTVLFDDFNDTSHFDTNITLKTGFYWYLNRNFAGYAFGTIPHAILYTNPATDYTVSGSILTLGPVAFGSGLETNLQTAAQFPEDGAIGGFIGNAFKLPMLLEHRSRYPETTSPGIGGGPPNANIVWSTSLDWVRTQANTDLTTRKRNGFEFDMGETSWLSQPQVNTWYYNDTFAAAQTNPGLIVRMSGQFRQLGPPLWSGYVAYSTSTAVIDPNDGLRYNMFAAPFGGPLNTPPHSDATHWAAAPYPGAGNPNTPVLCDVTQFHTYSDLLLPYQGSSPLGNGAVDAVGFWASFVDGVMTNVCMQWSPFQPTSPSGQSVPFHSMDGHARLVTLGCSSGISYQFDWFRIMQN